MRCLPSRRLFLGLFLASPLIALSAPLGLSVDAALVLLWAIDGFLLSRKTPEATLELPARLGQGQSAVGTIEIYNPSYERRRIQIAIDIPAALAGKETESFREMELPSRERLSLPISIHARARGRHRVDAVHWRAFSPLGLAVLQASAKLDRDVEVIPGLSEAKRHRLLALRAQEETGKHAVRARGAGGAFESLRSYVRGDDTRHIDWKASARRRTYIVRQYETERSQNILLCIDAGRLMAERVAGRERLDHSLTAAVVLNEVARTWGDNVGILAFSDEPQAFLLPDRHPPERIPSLCSRIEARGVEPDYPRALMKIWRSVSRRSLLVLFGDVIDEEVSAPLSVHLARMARRHFPLFVAIQNSDLFAAAGEPARDEAGARRRATATELVLARARTLARMREKGIHVVDAPPERAVGAAVRGYLEIKRRGVL